MDIGGRASRRTARTRPKLMPSASETCAPPLLSSTRSDMSSQTSRASAVRSRSSRHQPMRRAPPDSAPPPCAGPTRCARRVVAARPSTSTTAPQAGERPPGRVARGRSGRPLARAGGDDRPDDRDAERLADLPRGRRDRRGDAGLRARHPGHGGVRDRRVDEAEAEPEERRRRASSPASGVVGVEAGQQDGTRPAARRRRSASGRRGPRRPTMRPDSGDATTVMAAIGTVASPACTGERPRACWR